MKILFATLALAVTAAATTSAYAETVVVKHRHAMHKTVIIKHHGHMHGGKKIVIKHHD
jgi:replicative DNA helicase